MHDLDRLADTVDFVNGTINNISTTALTGTRLKRIRNKIDDLKVCKLFHPLTFHYHDFRNSFP